MLSRLFRKVRPRSVYDVMAAIACFGVLAGGTAYAANTIRSTDIIDGQVKSVDIGNGEVNSADVKDQSLTTFDVSTFLGADIVDGSLTGDDVGIYNQTVLQNFDVPARECAYGTPGFASPVIKEGDHALLTPNYNDTLRNLDFTAEVEDGIVVVKACNLTSGVLGSRNTRFNLLVIPQ